MSAETIAADYFSGRISKILAMEAIEDGIANPRPNGLFLLADPAEREKKIEE